MSGQLLDNFWQSTPGSPGIPFRDAQRAIARQLSGSIISAGLCLPRAAAITVQVAAGRAHTVLLCSDGSVAACGRNDEDGAPRAQHGAIAAQLEAPK